MELYFIEIPKLRKLDDSEEISDMLEVWVAFIQNPDSEIVVKLEMSKREIKEAKSELVRMSGDSKERYMYEKRKESILEKVSLIESAEQKGIERELKEGENKKAIEIAQNAITNNLDDNTIQIIIGLSLVEIKE